MKNQQKLIALTIWWCEGTKIRRDYRWKNSYLYPIEVTNSNPKIIKIFADFLRNELSVPNCKLKGQLQIHENDNKAKLEKYWSRATGIPEDQFNKTIIRKMGTRQAKNIGTFKLRTYNKQLFFKLKELLEKEIGIDGV